MKYRRVPSLDWDVSVLGLGARVATVPAPDAATHAPRAADYVELFRAAVDAGVNFLDLGWFAGMERCEPWLEAVRAALSDGYRERVRVAANVPASVAASRAEWERFFEGLTAALGVDHVDFCVIGGVDRDVWWRLLDAGFPDWADSIVQEGPVDALGFFICDDLQVLKRVMNGYDGWSLCKLRYAFWDHLLSRPGPTGVGYAAERGLMVVAAEPTQGALSWRDEDGRAGSAVALPEAVGLDGSVDEWSLRWTWDDPGISTVVCDLADASSLARVLDLADGVEPRSLSVRELTTLNRARDHYVKARPASCPACRTCMPCPEGIDIPRILDLGNDADVYGGVENAKATYQMEQQRAADCTACGLCEEACPRDVPIIGRLERARELFE